MKDNIDIQKEIISLIKSKVQYFRIFSEISSLRKKFKHKNQYKTEKWFQAELLVHLWLQECPSIQEYQSRKWDIYIPNQELINNSIHLALKCFTDSDQSAKQDFKKFHEDILKIERHDFSEGGAYVILLLPLGRNLNYLKEFEELVDEALSKYTLEIQKHDVLFSENEDSGISLYFLSKGES